MKLAAVLAAVLTLLCAPALVEAAPAPEIRTQRTVLPDDVRPERYEIRIVPEPVRLSFQGQARVSVRVLKPTRRIVLNAADLTFHRVSLSGAGEPAGLQIDTAAQTAAFVFDRPLAPGDYALSIDYSGRIYQQASGLFALDSAGPSGPVRTLFTQFENSDARRFAPTWDEPGIKAVFSLTVETPASQMAVSNMPVLRTEPLPGGRTAVTFADTPRMSAYLLFMALGDFERVHRQVGDVDVGVVVRRGEAAHAQYALETAAQLLAYYNDWFGLPYPLPKLDLVAGPGRSQFFRAMENWGAIFAFEPNLLLDARAGDADRQNVFATVAHEMAHQWFGDLVTMAWWDDLWLNEGFASWMEEKAADRFHPEWKTGLQAMASRERAMQLDAAPGTHPVITPIRDVFEASGAFDAITYQKGKAVLTMLEQYVGEDAFRTAIRAYLARHAYANTRTDDLWAELERLSPRPVSAIAHDFTLQTGVPMIRVDPAPGGVILTQDRFPGVGAPPTASWRAPVRVALASGGSWDGLVTRGQPQRVTAPGTQTPLANAGQAGYFRTRYAPELWAGLAPRFANLSPADQLGLIYDSRALGQAGVVPMTDFLALAPAAAASVEPVVVTALADELVGVARSYRSGEASPAFAAFARARLAPALAGVGWTPRPGDPSTLIAMRAELISVLGELGDPAVVTEARRRFRSGEAESLPAELRYAVENVVAFRAEPEDWDALHRLALKADSLRERERLYRLLGAARDPALTEKALALALSGEPSPTTAPAIIGAVAGRHPERAFEFALAHRAEVDALLEPTSRTIYFANLAFGARDPAIIPRLNAFAQTAPPTSRAEIDQAIGAIQRRDLFIRRRLPELETWLAQHPEAPS